MHLHLIRPTTTPADAERHVDALPVRHRAVDAERHESAVAAAIAMQRSYSAADNRRPRTFPACVGNCSQGRRPCASPEACHTVQIAPAEAATDIGAEQARTGYVAANSPERAARVMRGVMAALVGVPALVALIGFVASFYR